MRVSVTVFACAAALLGHCRVAALTAPARAEEFSKGERLFAIDVWPLLERKCLACHGKDQDDIRGGLDLTSRAAMLRGGETSDDVLLPGKAAESVLYRAITWEDSDYEMPPKENDRLTQEETWRIRDWINERAPWPDAQRAAAILEAHQREQAAGILVTTSGGLSTSWDNRRYQAENLWAYRPLVQPPLPPTKSGSIDDGNPVDAFINHRLEQRGLAAAPRADRRTLIRRATFDLLGLPPTPEEVDHFVNDPAPDDRAWTQVVERLLRSPRYGEQWGRHWLDVVRYADTAGFANDYERPNAWRYRDYVIRSFNDDKPYDDFVREQIAGDEIDDTDPQNLIATGFLRMGPWEQTGMSVARVTRQQFLDDITDSVGQVFLSHPLQCCRCHDHKFDPIPTRDYYRIQSVFATTQFAERDAPFLEEENTGGFDQEREYLQQRIKRYESILAGLRKKEEQAARHWYAERDLDYAPRQELLKRGVPEDQIAPRHIGLTTEDFGIERVARKNQTRHLWELDRFRPIAFSVYSGVTRSLRNVQSRLVVPEDPLAGGALEKTAILAGGNLFAPGEAVTPGVLSCLTLPDKTAPHDLPRTAHARRRALADWITDADNALTLRSVVNRVWQYHFGQGLARNPNNFGATGKKPTHPELLDWLAATFVKDGWSLKRLHRRIMLSDAYCRAAQHEDMESVRSKDPERTAYACFPPRRLSAEELRDSMLAVSGELNPNMGGTPIRPDINLEAALQPRQIMGTYAPAYQPSPRPEQRHRRSIYAMRIRGLRDPFMEVFNKPGSDTSCERRDVSTVTPQVFALFNSEQTYDRALAFAVRLRKNTDEEREAVRLAFRLTIGRQPHEEELKHCLAHWQSMTKRHSTLQWTPRPVATFVTRSAVEEMSGEPFTFVEKLEVYEDYVPDIKAWDVDPQTRGLAEVCLVLLNSNEFLYVY